MMIDGQQLEIGNLRINNIAILNFLKKLSPVFYTFLILVSTNVYSQSRSGRGYDWWDDDYVGDGGSWWLYFLIILWGSVFALNAFAFIASAVIENYKSWLATLKKILKNILIGITLILFLILIKIAFVIVVNYLDDVLPSYFDYIGRFLICLIWLAFIRYTFFNHKSSHELISYFKTSKGILIGLVIIAFVLLIIFN